MNNYVVIDSASYYVFSRDELGNPFTRETSAAFAELHNGLQGEAERYTVHELLPAGHRERLCAASVELADYADAPFLRPEEVAAVAARLHDLAHN